MMADIHKGLPGVQNDLDDIIVYGNTPTEHDQILNTQPLLHLMSLSDVAALRSFLGCYVFD